MRTKVTAVIAAALMLVGLSAAPASAGTSTAGWSSVAAAVAAVGGGKEGVVNTGVQPDGCHIFSMNTVGHRRYVQNNDTSWGYSSVYVVPSTSTCNDINVSNIRLASCETGGCGFPYYVSVMVELLHTDNTHASWGGIYIIQARSSSWVVIASSVLNGTHYRVQVADGVDDEVGGLSSHTGSVMD